MDAGIIASLKRRDRNLQYNMDLDALDSEEDKIYKIDQLTDMKCVQAAWGEVSDLIIANFWKSTGILRLYADGTEIDGVGTGQEMRESAAIDTVLVNLVAKTRRMSISNILNSEDLDIHEEVSDVEMAASVLGELVGNVESGDEEPDADELDTTSVIQSTIEEVRTVMRVNESQPVINCKEI